MTPVRTITALAFALALLAGCSSTTPPAPAENPGPPGQSFVVPTPASDQVGIVTGKITNVRPDANPELYKQGFQLYLGSILSSDQGVEGMVSLDRVNSPKAMTDAEGNFAFTDVPPGRYGLWLDSPTAPLLLNEPDSGQDFIIEVEAGKVKSLGTLAYELPF